VSDSSGTSNTAERDATVGMQARDVTDSTVYMNSTVYQVDPAATPSKKYEIGVKYLETGAPDRARGLIAEAIALGHDSGEVRFHWVLAMLSKRSYRDLDLAERRQISDVSDVLPGYADDEWKDALEAICELLECLRSHTDPARALKKVDDVGLAQRDMIDRHLDLVLTGGLKDSRWTRIHQNAVNDRAVGDRHDRAWAYFQPVPEKPRARVPAPVSIRRRDWVTAVGGSALVLVAVGKLGQTALALHRPVPMLACALVLVSGHVAAVYGLRWHYSALRLRTKERQHTDRRGVLRPPEGGFASEVDHDFEHYFARYVPSDVTPWDWRLGTAGIRRTLRDEIVEIYREQRVKAGSIRWLVRYLVADTRKRWSAGTLWDYRVQYRTPLATKAWFFTAVIVLGAALDTVVTAVAPTRPVALAYAGLGLVSGRAAGFTWRRIVTEHWRHRDEQAEYDAAYLERLEEFQRWSGKLESIRPSESEMEYWLYCDRTVLLGKALSHYQLAWRDVIAHAFLQVPASRYKRARAAGGPWRYSKYDVRLFLVTLDGVREVSGELDFERALFWKEDRENYSFRQVSSVRVIETTGFEYTLKLTLTNGPTRDIRITERAVVEQGADEEPEDPEKLFRMNLETTGFAHTLHILEGIAAEGASWITRDPLTVKGFQEAAR